MVRVAAWMRGLLPFIVAVLLCGCGERAPSGRARTVSGLPAPTTALPSVVAIRHCRGTAYAPEQSLPLIDVVEVTRMTCAQGVEVMRHVAPALSENYYDRLGKTRNRPVAGYRCSGSLIGDGAWSITCRRGSHVVTGLTAE
jgi:hypothetical protein